jgi:hypothetical protein
LSRGVTARTFHRWGVRCCVDFRESEKDGAFGKRLLVRLRGEASLGGRYDAVLIDEAQDWPCCWFQCARLALKEPETGDLLIVGDGSQSLYRKWDFTWAECRHSCLRPRNPPEVPSRSQLRQHRRNLRAARAFSVPPGSGMQGVLALPVEPNTAIRSGPELLLVRLDSPGSEMQYAAALIETWLREDHADAQRTRPAVSHRFSAVVDLLPSPPSKAATTAPIAAYSMSP